MSLQLKIIFYSFLYFFHFLFFFMFLIYCLLKILEMLEILFYNLIHSQLFNPLWYKIGLLILHVLLLLIWAFNTALCEIGLFDFRLWVFRGLDPIHR